MAEVGNIALVLALIASVYSIITLILGTRRESTLLLTSARSSLLATFGLVSISTVVLIYALVNHNFQIEYVATYTSRDLSLPYLISALWAGNTGSLLLWSWLLSLFAAIVVWQQPEDKDLVPYASAVTMIIEAFFLILLIFAAKPFHKLATIPADGIGLNPMLENPAMIIHPPVLLAGYVAFTIPFAFALAALIRKRLDEMWLAEARGWALIAWIMLGTGNLIGAWWAYVELGWGGYWAWDPVENAGLMPWLVGTAFLHSAVVQRRMGIFRGWSFTLIILTFLLTIFGTFLTRSDILSSVHTFGETGTGPFLLTLLLIIFLGAFGLLFYRLKELKNEASVESLVSKESSLLLNNFLLLAATFAIFVGTIFPIISRVISQVEVNVGSSFFNQINVPIFLAIVFLAGICVTLGWRRPSLRQFGRNLLWPLVITLVVLVVLLVFGVRVWYAAVAYFIATFAIIGTIWQGQRQLAGRQRRDDEIQSRPVLARLWANKNRYGAYIVHLAIVIIAIGITGSSVYATEKNVVLKPGESITIEQYKITYDNMEFPGDQDKMIIRASLSVHKGNRFIGKLFAEKYYHRNFQPVTEVAIRSTVAEDLYIILTGWDMNGTAGFRILVNPLVMWLWVGGGVFLAGGLICFWPTTPELKGKLRGHVNRR